MAAKQIKLKFTLTHLNNYAGGAEKFLNDLKTAYASIMRIADKQTGSDVFSFGLAFFPQDDPNHFYSGETDDCQKLNQINSLTIYRVESNLIPDTPVAPKSIKQTKNDKDTENIIINDNKEIAILKLEFLNLDNTVYNMPDNATINGNELEISFLEAASHTITFTNTTHGEFDIDLPLPINVPDGENILLPSVSGQFEDEDYIYTPSQWDIGEFGESIYPIQDMTADLMWNREEIPETLPTVSLHGDFGSDNWLYTDSSQSSSVSVVSNSQIGLLLDRSYQTYDDSKSYAVQQWYVNSSTVGTTGDFIITKQGLTQIAAKNVSSSTKYILKARVAICSSNQAEIVIVYNMSNESFNAFKYTLGGTDYYYVLDGAQTDWTDDLSSIGYSLDPPAPLGLTAYFTTQGSAGTSDTYVRTIDYPYLYDANGLLISYDSSKTYTVVEVRQYDGTVLSLSSYVTGYSDGFALYFHQDSGNYNMYLVIYTES